MAQKAKSVDWWWSEEFDEWTAEQLIHIATMDQSTLVKNCLLLGLPILMGCPQLINLQCDMVNGSKEIKESVRLPEEIHELLRQAIRQTKASSSDLIRVCVRIVAPLLAMRPSFDLSGKLSFFWPNGPSDK